MTVSAQQGSKIHDLPEMRDRKRVFRDRVHAGEVLAGMLESYRFSDGIVFGIPAGGVPVGTVVASKLEIPFDVAIVSKITLPWNTEAGYGAVAFDGTVRMNRELLSRLDLTDKDMDRGIEKTLVKVNRRIKSLRGSRPFPVLSGRSVILVDDGLASGFTMRVAVEALQEAGGDHIIVGVPTGHSGSVEWIASAVEALFCPNIRSGWRFAVAEAYERWSDVDESEAAKLIGK